MNKQTNTSEKELDNPMDINVSKPSKSRYLFFLGFFGFFIFSWAGCYNLYEHKYSKNDNVNVPSNTLYEPQYK